MPRSRTTTPAELLVQARRVRTLDPGQPAEAFADAALLRHGRIAAVGRRDALRAAAPGAPLLDLGSSVLTPGFTDAHIHLTEWALARHEVALDEADTPAEAAALGAAGRPGAGGWIRGRGWNPHRWGGAYPAAGVLDAAVGGRLVALQSHDMHALWVSGAALARAGIHAATPDPPGGRIVRGPDGAPTGVLLEHAGQLVTACIPTPASGAVADAVVEAQAALHRLGITGVHSLPGLAVPEPDPLPILTALRAEGRLALRVLQHIRLERLDAALALGLRSGFGGGGIRIGAVKFFLDGALGSRTAWMRAPYEGGTDVGVRMYDTADFREHVARAAAGGLAAVVHAIGDAAVAQALDVLGDPALRVAALPHRIEHVQCCPPERLADAGRLGVVCSVQPAHLCTDWPVVDAHWGAARARGTYAFRSLAAGGAVLAFGSDAPVEPVDPRLALHAALTRTDRTGQPQGGWQPGERMDRLAALLAYTAGPASAAGAAGVEGVIRPGARADLAAWSADPLAEEVAPLELACRAVLVGGAVVWRD